MRSRATNYRSYLLRVLQLLIIVIFSYSRSFATMGITINGLANGASFAQGSSFQWNITGLGNGATVANQLWIDLNSNGIIEPGSDLLFVSFGQTDGVTSSDGPGDEDGLANGTIQTTVSEISFPVSNYIFKSISGTDSAQSTFSVTAMSSPSFYVSGNVSDGVTGLMNITVGVQTLTNEYYALTDINGDYSITTDIISGTPVKVRVPTESFNSQLSGYIISPNQVDTVLTADISNIDFTVSVGKIVTGFVSDTLGNPIVDLAVGIYPPNGGNGYDGRTDVNGNYFIPVDTGSYRVQFGRDQEPKGYLKTYYNQKYIGWLSDIISITPSTDSLKNINAVIRNGAVIMGTFKYNGVSTNGSITAFAFNNGINNPLYESWHDSTQNVYYLFVPPGNYTIKFDQSNGVSQVYFNQSFLWPGTMVHIGSLSDSVKNINVEFSTVRHKYIFTGNGNWNNSSNWRDNLMPPSILSPGDSIIINHAPGGQCILNVSQQVTTGGFMRVIPGKSLVIPGELKLE